MATPVKRWQLLIAEIIFEYNEYLMREEDYPHHCNNLDDYDSFVDLPDFDAGEFGEFKIIQEVDDNVEYNTHKKKLIFSWKGKFYEFLYDYFSHDGAYYDNYPNPLNEVEPITEIVQRYIYKS